MDSLEAGESFIVTRNGKPVGTLMPLTGPRQYVPSDELVAALADLPPLDFATLRADGDRFFGDEGDRIPRPSIANQVMSSSQIGE